MSAVSDDITADFIIEAQEILDRLGEQLVSLEQAPQDADQLNAVFRGFHTLKGGAGFLGVTAMVELCHAAEEALGIARAGQAVLQAHHFDAAQQSLDYLQSMLDAVSSGTEPGYAPPDLIAQFDMNGGTAAPVAAAAPAAGGAARNRPSHCPPHARAPRRSHRRRGASRSRDRAPRAGPRSRPARGG